MSYIFLINLSFLPSSFFFSSFFYPTCFNFFFSIEIIRHNLCFFVIFLIVLVHRPKGYHGLHFFLLLSSFSRYSLISLTFLAITFFPFCSYFLTLHSVIKVITLFFLSFFFCHLFFLFFTISVFFLFLLDNC